MASYRKTANGWRADIFKDGIRRSKTFRAKRDAIAWANEIEFEIQNGHHSPLSAPPNSTFSRVLIRYRDEVSPLKRGTRWERIRIDAMLRDPLLADLPLDDIGPRHFARWRDARLRSVSGSTVSREMNILAHACKLATREWQWLDKNPIKGVSRPQENRPRDRVIQPDEIDAYVRASGFSFDRPPSMVKNRVGAMFLFACETAMRGGEICKIRTRDLDLERRILFVPETKTDQPRWVPLSRAAIKILEHLMTFTDGRPTVFDVKSSQRDAISRKIMAQARLEGITFHDTRRTALTRLAETFGPMELAKISGHQDLRILQSVYYAPDPSDLAKKLD